MGGHITASIGLSKHIIKGAIYQGRQLPVEICKGGRMPRSSEWIKTHL